jgi:hypothetical protein
MKRNPKKNYILKPTWMHTQTQRQTVYAVNTGIVSVLYKPLLYIEICRYKREYEMDKDRQINWLYCPHLAALEWRKLFGPTLYVRVTSDICSTHNSRYLLIKKIKREFQKR